MTVAPGRDEVIVAEDDADLRDMLGAALGRSGYEALLHPDAESALDAGAQRPPAMYLFDVELPGMSGIEACRLVKASARLRRPVLLTSADFAAMRVREAHAAGADALLPKPFTLRELADAVRGVLAGARTD